MKKGKEPKKKEEKNRPPPSISLLTTSDSALKDAASSASEEPEKTSGWTRSTAWRRSLRESESRGIFRGRKRGRRLLFRASEEKSGVEVTLFSFSESEKFSLDLDDERRQKTSDTEKRNPRRAFSMQRSCLCPQQGRLSICGGVVGAKMPSSGASPRLKGETERTRWRFFFFSHAFSSSSSSSSTQPLLLLPFFPASLFTLGMNLLVYYLQRNRV